MTDTVHPTSPDFDIGGRVSFWLRSHGYTAKRTARLIAASEATGKRLRSGATPTTEQMARLYHHFGWRFVQHVYEALLGPSDAALDRDLHDIKARLQRLENADASIHETGPSVLPMAGTDMDCPS